MYSPNRMMDLPIYVDKIESTHRSKVTINYRFTFVKDTELDLVFKRSSYWQQTKEKAKRLVQRKRCEK
jgi:hypothetical protein